MLIRIHGHTLPGLTWDESRDIHVGLQRKREPDQLVAGDAGAAVFIAEVEARPAGAGFDFRGPHVQGPPGTRFIYLTWGEHPDAGTFTMFRRAKLQLDAVPPETIAAAVASGCLEGTLSLTDPRGRGGPLCAAVRPPLVAWSAAIP